MSYARYKDKIFQCGNKNAARKNSNTQLLRNSSSCSDLRYDIYNSKEFCCETLASTKTVAGKYVPPDCVINLLMTQKTLLRIPSICKLKRSSSAESLTEFEKQKYEKEFPKSDKLSLKRNESSTEQFIEEDNPQCHQEYEKINYFESEEIENLRKLVLDMNTQISYLEQFKHENIRLKQLVHNDAQRQLDKALSENNILAKKLDAFSSLHEKSVATLEEVGSLRSECRRLEGELDEARKRCESLQKKLGYETNLASRVAADSAAQLAASNERAAALEALVPQFAVHLRLSAEASAWQQERFAEKVIRLKQIADMSSLRADATQKKLDLYEELVVQLEAVRTELRTCNLCYKEAAFFFRNQLQVALAAGQSMATTIEELCTALRSNEKEFERISHWPGSAEATVQVARMKGILAEDSAWRSDGAVLALARLRGVMRDLEIAAWERRGRLPPHAVADASSQSLPPPSTCSTSVQSLSPKSCSTYVQACSLPQVPSVNDSAAGVVVTAAVIVRLRSRVKRASAREAAAKAVMQLYESLLCFFSDYFCSLVQELTTEFNNYTYTFEIYSKLVEKIANIQNEDLFEMLTIQNEQHKSRVQLMESNILLLEMFLVNEMKINKKLEAEVQLMADDLSVRSKVVEKLFVLWENAESRLQMELKKQIAQKSIICNEVVSTKLERMSIMLSERDTEIKITSELNNKMEVEIKKWQTRCFRLKQSMRNRCKLQETQARQLSKVQRQVKAVKSKLVGMKSVFLKSQEFLELLKKSNESLCTENHSIREEIGKMQNQNGQLKKIIWKLKSFLNKESSKSFRLQAENAKVKKKLHLATTRIELLISAEKENNDKSMSANRICYNLQKNLDDSEATIDQLKEEVLLLKNYSNELEEKLREESSKSVIEKKDSSTTIDVDVDIVYELQHSLDEIKINFATEVEELKKEHSQKLEENNQLYLKNLNFLKETYERDIKILKNEHAESIMKMQNFQKEEIANLKRLKVEESSKEIEMEQMKSNYEEELNSQKMNYDNLLEEVMTSAKEDKEKLVKELARITAEKDAKIIHLSDKMENEIKLLKKKCKSYIKNVEKKKHAILGDRFRSDIFERRAHESTSDSKLIIDSDTRSETDGSFNSYPGTYERNQECLQDIGGGGDGFDEKAILLRKIAELEEQIMEYNCFNFENACDAEKGIWKERERNNELNQSLQQEMEKNRILSIKLASKRERIAELEEKNLMLIDEMKIMSRSKWQMVTKSMDLEQLQSSCSSNEILEETLLAEYADLRMEFIQQCGINHRVSQRTAQDHIINSESVLNLE